MAAELQYIILPMKPTERMIHFNTGDWVAFGSSGVSLVALQIKSLKEPSLENLQLTIAIAVFTFILVLIRCIQAIYSLKKTQADVLNAQADTRIKALQEEELNQRLGKKKPEFKN